MRFIHRAVLGIMSVSLLGACSDNPTGPTSRAADLDAATIASTDQAAGCVTDGICILPPVIVPGECDPYLSLDWCGGECVESASGGPDVVGAEGCNDPGGTGPGTGGGGTEPPPPGVCPDWDPNCDQNPEPPAEDHSNDEGIHCTDLGCKLRDVTDAERQKVLDEISSLREEGFCGEVRANALAMVNRRLQVWENRVYAPNDQGQMAVLLGEAPWSHELQAPIMYLWTGAINAWTIAHESLHGMWNDNTTLGNYYTHSNITPLGMNLDDTAKYCSRN
jgi:hypothetical protein